MTVFTRTWNAAYEAVPADSDQISEGALRIRQTKVDVQERGAVDHSWAGDVEDGTHLKVTFTDPLAVKPTQELDNTYLYTKDVSATSELFFEDEAGNEVQLTNAGSADFPAGTAMLFHQNNAPTGWSIDTAVDEHSVRLTQGTGAEGDPGSVTGGTRGGSNDFGDQFAAHAENADLGVRNHSLDNLESPSHNHWILDYDSSSTDMTSGYTGSMAHHGTSGVGSQYIATKGSSTAGSAKTSSSGAGLGHAHTVDLDVKWAACIIATKDA